MPGATAGTFFVLVAFVTNTIASQDGDDFSTDEILAELTGEAAPNRWLQAVLGGEGMASSL